MAQAETILDPNDFFLLRVLGEPIPRTLTELIDAGLAHASPASGEAFNWILCAEKSLLKRNPALLLTYIEGMLARGLTEHQRSCVAAGPLEDLLAEHGETFIDEIELKARREPVFRALLAGVWQNRMSDALWERVQIAANTKGKSE